MKNLVFVKCNCFAVCSHFVNAVSCFFGLNSVVAHRLVSAPVFSPPSGSAVKVTITATRAHHICFSYSVNPVIQPMDPACDQLGMLVVFEWWVCVFMSDCPVKKDAFGDRMFMSLQSIHRPFWKRVHAQVMGQHPRPSRRRLLHMVGLAFVCVFVFVFVFVFVCVCYDFLNWNVDEPVGTLLTPNVTVLAGDVSCYPCAPQDG